MLARATAGLILCMACIAITATPALAQQRPGAPPAPALPPNAAELDLLLAKKQHLLLSQILARIAGSDVVMLDMNWEREKLLAGESALISFAYAYDLWRVALVVPADQAAAAAEFKETAVLIMLYAYEVIVTDGLKCQDASAPAHRRDQLFSTYPYIWKHIASLSDDRLARLVDTALRMEQGIASRRADDDFLCRDGLDQMRDAFERNGDKPLQEVPQPGRVGKTVAIPTDPDYKPKFVSKDVWLPKQAEARAAMPKALSQIVTQYKAMK